MRGVLIFFILLISLHTVTATTLLVDPTRIINTSLTPGSKFTVNVNVSDVIDLASYQFKLSFNKTVLNVTGVKSINPIWNCYKYQINNSLGIVWIECVLDGSLNENAKLEAINFSVIGTGESNLNLYGTLLGDSQGTEISHGIRNGFFSNNPTGSCIKSNPNVTLSPSLQNGSAGSLFYNTVNVINNDNNYCDSSIFSLAYQCPSTWSCSLNKNSILIYPQLNDSSTILTINSSVSATLGNYTVNITATNNSYTNKSSTNITIISLENKTTITAGADPYTVERYQNTTLWCDYRNATSNSEILGANVEFQVIINSTYTINYTGIYNTTNNVYEYSYNSTYPGWDAVRCNASATNYEYNFATFSLVTCGISPQLTLSPAYQSGNVGSALNYTVEVYDADVPGICGNSTYNLSVKGLPTGWDYSFFSNIFNLDAAASNSTNLTLTSSALASSGNYTINVTVTNLNNSNYKSINSLIYNISGGSTTTTSTTSTSTTIPKNYLQINGTTFTQPQAINITGWCDDLSKTTYIYKNVSSKNPDFLMQKGIGKQYNISLSSAWNAVWWNISVNSTDNKTLEWRTFRIVSTSTSTTSTISTSTTSISTTSTTSTTSTSTSSTTTSTTTTTIPRNTDTRLYLNETEGDFYYLNNTYANFTVWVNASGIVYISTNITGWTILYGSSPFIQIVQLNSTQNNTYYNITGYFPGNATHDPTSQMHYAIVYVSTTVATTTIETTTINQGGGGGGDKKTTTTIIYNATTTVKTNTTTTTVLTNMTISTIKSCISTGSICTSDSECCSLYCCNNVCSDLQCAKKTELIKYIIIIYALLLGIISGYYLYLKEIKTNLNKPKLTAPIQEKIPSIPIENIKKELTYLKNIAQNLKKRGYDVSGSEVELLSTEYYLKRNSSDLAASHLEKAKENLKNFFK